MSGQAGSEGWTRPVCCHLSPYPSPLAQGKPRAANFQQGFLSSVHAAISSYFAGDPAVVCGTDRNEDTWVETERMQSGFQGTPSVHDPFPSFHPGALETKAEVCCLDASNEQFPCLMWKGLRAAIPSDWKGGKPLCLWYVDSVGHEGSKNLLPLPWPLLGWPKHVAMVWSWVGLSWHLRPTQGEHRELVIASQG